MTGDAVTRFSYFQWEDLHWKEKPYYLYIDCPKDKPLTNFKACKGPEETVYNLRGMEDQFNLDDNGFTVKHQQFCLGVINEQTVTKEYLPSLETLISDTIGEDCEIIWFDWRSRSSDKAKTEFPTGTRIELDDRTIDLAPAKTVHVDQTPRSAISRVNRHAGDRAQELLKGRVRIINIWRPCASVVESHPLALLDGSTVPSEKLVEVDVVRPSYVGESYYPMEHNGYRWYFMDKQTKEEVLLFKMYDSNEAVKAKCCPHASFTYDSLTENPRPRESIEARALVFTRG
ncbi:hypothetical protein QQS21_010069 [Conoideocrella luteorostrata]|uniref:Methyltransferase n=1 Tax=Conoideocrella luteorostrata TaxID=1105319 RepID=A0AAJ0CGQ3_9HYPO|nr:hypothetical protein QQS21_010069 [Conoideocrella luteorostrata]